MISRMVRIRALLRLLVLAAACAPAAAFALEHRTILMTTGIRVSFATAVQNVVGYLAVSSVAVCTVLFLVGATYLVGSAGQPGPVETGKKLMKGSIIGMAIVLLSYSILRTVLFLIY